MKRILSKREQIILYITISVIIFSVAFNFFIAPVLSKNDNLNKEINFTRSKLKKYMRLLAQKDIIRSKNSKFSSTHGSSGEEENSVSALSELENLASKANILIIDIRPDSAKNLLNYKETVIELRAEADIEGYLRFIYDIEHPPSSFTVKKLQLSAKPNSRLLEGFFIVSQISSLE